MSGKVCVVGSFMTDLIAQAPRRPYAGETLVGTGFSQELGGKGFNQAVAAARAGAEVRMIGAVGDDAYGHAFLERLAAEHIDGGAVRVLDDTGTGVGLPLVEPSGENSIVIVPRANRAFGPAYVRSVAEVIASADIVLLQQEISADAVRAAAEVAREAGTLVALNPAPADPAYEIVKDCVDLLVPNELEARSMAGRPDGEPEEVAKTLVSDWGPRRLVITLGASGSLAVEDGELWRVEPHPAEAFDTVGAGDAFCGSLVAELAAGQSLREAARYASVAAAVSVTRRGGAASVPPRSHVLPLL